MKDVRSGSAALSRYNVAVRGGASDMLHLPLKTLESCTTGCWLVLSLTYAILFKSVVRDPGADR